MRVKKNGTYISAKSAILAADEDEGGFGFDEPEDMGEFDDMDGADDKLDDMADDIEDLQDTIDEVTEDDVNIEVDNNIEGHYIAECDKCHGIFISAMVESDQPVTSIRGTCPLCDSESEQYLKWVIKKAE